MGDNDDGDVTTDSPIHTRRMGRHDDFELWREVARTTVGLTGIVELFAKRVRRADRLDFAREAALAAWSGRQLWCRQGA